MDCEVGGQHGDMGLERLCGRCGLEDRPSSTHRFRAPARVTGESVQERCIAWRRMELELECLRPRCSIATPVVALKSPHGGIRCAASPHFTAFLWSTDAGVDYALRAALPPVARRAAEMFAERSAEMRCVAKSSPVANLSNWLGGEACVKQVAAAGLEAPEPDILTGPHRLVLK